MLSLAFVLGCPCGPRFRPGSSSPWPWPWSSSPWSCIDLRAQVLVNISVFICL